MSSAEQGIAGRAVHEVVVQGNADGFAQEIVAGSHHFKGDEPSPREAPTPVRRPTISFWRRWDRALP